MSSTYLKSRFSPIQNKTKKPSTSPITMPDYALTYLPAKPDKHICSHCSYEDYNDKFCSMCETPRGRSS